MTTVSVVVPARNEAARIRATVEALRSVGLVEEVIVVDDASEDATSDEATRAGATVTRHARRRGKGGALRTGVAAATGEVLAFVDGDLGATAAVVEPLLRPVLDGAADMTIAAPPAGAPSGFGMVEGLARWGIRARTGATMRRPLSGQRAMRRQVLTAVPIADGFAVETALTIGALRAGYRVIEVPYTIEHNRTGRDLRGFLHRGKQGVAVLRALATPAGRRIRR